MRKKRPHTCQPGRYGNQYKVKTAKQILNFLTERIGHIYFRPLMYCDSPGSIDQTLHYYHELWSEITEQKESYFDFRTNLLLKEGCGSSDFATHFQKTNPGASEEAIVKYTIKQWKIISEALKIPIDYVDISRSLQADLP